jgi:hypothetical protein
MSTKERAGEVRRAESSEGATERGSGGGIDCC